MKLCCQPCQIAFAHAEERCCVLGTTPAGWYDEEQELVGKGCDCQCCAPAGLENHPGGVKDSGIWQVNVFALYSLGAAKKNTLGAVAQSVESCLA